MKKTKVLAILFLVFGGLLIGFGVYKSIDSLNSKEQEKVSEQEKYDKQLGVVRNNKDAMKKEQCLNKVCVEDIKVFNIDEVSYVTGTIINKGDNRSNNEYYNINFYSGKKLYDKITIDVSNLKANDKFPLEYQVNDLKALLVRESSSYNLTKATEEDIKKFKESIG